MTSSAQGWAFVGILGTLATGLLALVAVSQQSLRAFLEAKFETVDVRFAAVEQRFAEVDRRFDGVDRHLDALDRDVQALSQRVFRDRP